MKVYSVFLPDLKQRPHLIARYEALLSDAETERYRQMRDDLRRLQFLAGRAVIQAVCHQSPRLLTNGKPVVDKGYISLAHSGPYVLLAVGDSPVGIDIEDASKQKDFDRLAARLNFHLSGEKKRSFYEQFTRYEATYKLGENRGNCACFYYSIDTFIVCIITLNKNEKIEFINTLPFELEIPFTPTFSGQETQ